MKPLLIGQEGAFLLPEGSEGDGFGERNGQRRHGQAKEEITKNHDETSYKIQRDQGSES